MVCPQVQQFIVKQIQRLSRNGVSLEGKIEKPKFHGRSLVRCVVTLSVITSVTAVHKSHGQQGQTGRAAEAVEARTRHRGGRNGAAQQE